MLPPTEGDTGYRMPTTSTDDTPDPPAAGIASESESETNTPPPDVLNNAINSVTNMIQKNTKRMQIAFAITITRDGKFQDGAAVMAYSIDKAFRDDGIDIAMIAFVHPDVNTSRPFLEKVGYRYCTGIYLSLLSLLLLHCHCCCFFTRLYNVLLTIAVLRCDVLYCADQSDRDPHPSERVCHPRQVAARAHQRQGRLLRGRRAHQAVLLSPGGVRLGDPSGRRRAHLPSTTSWQSQHTPIISVLISYHVIPCHIMPCSTMPCHASSVLTTRYRYLLLHLCMQSFSELLTEDGYSNRSLIYTTDPNMASFKGEEKLPVQVCLFVCLTVCLSVCLFHNTFPLLSCSCNT